MKTSMGARGSAPQGAAPRARSDFETFELRMQVKDLFTEHIAVVKCCLGSTLVSFNFVQGVF